MNYTEDISEEFIEKFSLLLSLFLWVFKKKKKYVFRMHLEILALHPDIFVKK